MSERVALTVAYNGSSFHGFQYQNDELPTIQMALERAIGRVANHTVEITCAGRTDAGVHATHQVIHFDTVSERPLSAWQGGVNRYLPDTISIESAVAVDSSFNARFSAECRRYLYLIFNRRARHPLLSDGLTHVNRPLDARLMHDGAQCLVGEHDFSSFRAAHCQARSPVRKIQSISVQRRGELVMVDVTASAFLHHMVRNIVGVLLRVGTGKAEPGWVGEVLDQRNRQAAAETAPANGLYLVDVGYPDACGITSGPSLPHLFSLLPS